MINIHLQYLSIGLTEHLPKSDFHRCQILMSKVCPRTDMVKCSEQLKVAHRLKLKVTCQVL